MERYLLLGLLAIAAIWSATSCLADEQTVQAPPPKDQIVVKPTTNGDMFASGQYNAENFSVGAEAYVKPNGENGEDFSVTSGNLFASSQYSAENFSVGSRVYINPSNGERGGRITVTIPTQ
jgi:hypothetical protein